MTGLAIVPVLPYLFDHPVEKATDVAFEWVEGQFIQRGWGGGAGGKGTDGKNSKDEL